MTREEKLRMLLHPDKYTEEQLDQMLKETDSPVPDAEEAWNRFERETINVKKSTSSSFRKIAAIFIGTLLLSGITIAAIQIWKNSSRPTPSEQSTTSTQLHTERDTIAPTLEVPTSSVEESEPVKIYEDTDFSTMLNEIASYYQYEIVYHNEGSKHVRLYFTWDKSTSIEDVVAMFNKFDRIHITLGNRQLIVK
ncbi:MAG: DUF4974 domain-containing protein [Prevotella sp.]|nr:DUF4974 domain-containing protein [Prevotella sp.]